MASMVAVPAAVSHAVKNLPGPECKQDDPRFLSLRKFFHKTKCPLESASATFIHEADVHHLDWRLLPGLSVIESGGGKSFRGNNVFGWNNGNSSFASIRDGIHFVAAKLAYSKNYRNKGVTEKLLTYNPNEGYSDSVKWVMRQISNTEVLD